jgi:hypothetical protein
MRRACSISFMLLLLLTMTLAADAQTGGSTVSAASCRGSDVNAMTDDPVVQANPGLPIIRMRISGMRMTAAARKAAINKAGSVS